MSRDRQIHSIPLPVAAGVRTCMDFAEHTFTHDREVHSISLPDECGVRTYVDFNMRVPRSEPARHAGAGSRSGWRDYRHSSLSPRTAFELRSDPRCALFIASTTAATTGPYIPGGACFLAGAV